MTACWGGGRTAGLARASLRRQHLSRSWRIRSRRGKEAGCPAGRPCGQRARDESGEVLRLSNGRAGICEGVILQFCPREPGLPHLVTALRREELGWPDSVSERPVIVTERPRKAWAAEPGLSPQEDLLLGRKSL